MKKGNRSRVKGSWPNEVRLVKGMKEGATEVDVMHMESIYISSIHSLLGKLDPLGNTRPSE